MVSKKNHSKKNHNFAKYIYVISMDIPTNKEKLFNTIYTTEHIPYIMKIPGIYSVNQFKTVPANFNKTSLLNLNNLNNDKSNYMTIYYIKSPNIIKSKLWNYEIQQGNWSSKISPFTSNRKHYLYKII